MKIIKINDKASFCVLAQKHLSDLLNQKIEFADILDELTLYEWGANPKNEVLSKYVVNFLKQCTTENPKSQRVN